MKREIVKQMTPFSRAMRSCIRALVRCYPMHSGVMRLINVPLLKRLTSAPEVVITRLRGGERIIVDVSDYCGRPIYYWGDYDRRVTQICVDVLSPGDYMLDIGANYGEVALAAASRVGPEGAVHAFEPNPRIWRYLQVSAELNGLSNLHVHNVALGEDNGTVQLAVPDGNSGAAFIQHDAGCTGEKSAKNVPVQMRNAAEFIEQLELPALSVIKLDVEGMEPNILRAMSAILKRYEPRMIVFESHETDVPFFERESVKFLKEMRYAFYQLSIARTLKTRPVLIPVLVSEDVSSGYDFIAMRQGVSVSQSGNGRQAVADSLVTPREVPSGLA